MAKNQRSTVISPGRGGDIAAAGRGVANQLRGLGYELGQVADDMQKRQDVALQQDLFNDITETSQKIYLENKDSPDNFNKVFKSYQDEMLETVPARLKPRVKQELDSQRLRRWESTTVNFSANQDRERDASNYRFNINAQNSVLNEFRAGNVKHANQLINEIKVANLASGSYTPEQVEVMHDKLLNAGIDQRVKGEAERALKTDGLKGLELYREGIEKAKDLFSNPDQKDRAMQNVDRMISGEQSRLKQIKAADDARLKSTRNDVSKKVGALSDTLELGYDIDPAIGAEFDTVLDVLDMEDDKKKLDAAYRGQQFARMPAPQRQQMLSQLIEKAPQEYTHYKNIDSKVTQLENADPILHFQRQGKIKISPIDLNDPSSIAKRNESAMQLKEMTGMDVPLLTGQEQKAIIKTFNTLPANQKSMMVGNLVSGLGADSIPTLNSLATKQGGTLALAGQLAMDGAPDVAESMFMGQEVMRDMKEIMPKEADFNIELDTYLSTAYAENPLQSKTVRSAIKAVYADMSRNDGDTSGIIDSARLKSATDQVTGGLIDYESGKWSWGGESSKIEPPQRGMTSDQFSDWIDELTVDDVEAMGGSNMNSKTVLKLLKDDAQLVSVRVQGKPNPVYIIKTDSGTIANKDGTAPFYLEYTRGTE